MQSKILKSLVELKLFPGGNSLSAGHLPEFPRLSEKEVAQITLGKYQMKLAASYVQDKIKRYEPQSEEGLNTKSNGYDEVFQVDLLNRERNLLRVRIYSRHRQRTLYTIWIEFGNERLGVCSKKIKGHYCTCPVGARTLGTCAHVAAFWRGMRKRYWAAILFRKYNFRISGCANLHYVSLSSAPI